MDNLGIIISFKSSVPIYEQIIRQIKELILNEELKAGDMLPSVRMLAKDLGIAVLTVQKAYDKLQKDGIIEGSIGKGTYVTENNLEKLEDKKNQFIEDMLIDVINVAKKNRIELDQLINLMTILYKE